MPQFTVPLEGGGSMTVNASSQQAALDNVKSTGNTPAGGGSAPAPSGTATSSGGQQLYMTVNGPKTVDQMNAELRAAGWPGPPAGTEGAGATSNAYMQTTGGNVVPMSGGSVGDTGAGTATDPTGTSMNKDATQMILNDAQQKAYQAYLNSRLQLDNDTLAFQKATEAFNQTVTQAGLTGMYQGSPTQSALQFAATNFGTWGMPQQGQQTLAAQQQAFNQAQNTAQLTGWYTPPSYSPVPPITSPATGGASWTAPTSAQYVQARTQQLIQQGFDATRAAQTAQAEWQQGYAQSGNVAYGLPTGISFTAPAQTAASGTTAPGQVGQPGGQPVQTLAGNEQAYTQWLRAQQQSLAQWQAQQSAAQNYLQMMANLRGPADWAQYQKVLGATPQGIQDLVRAAAGQYIPGGGATSGTQPTPITLGGFVGQTTGPADTSSQAAMNSLVAPNQMAPQTWNALTPSQQQMLLGAWENQGYTQQDAQALFNQSLPKYATGAPSAGSFRLQ